MLQYIVLSSVSWGSLVVFYLLFLRKEKYFNYNRIFLLASLIIGLIVPLLPHINIASSFAFSTTITNLSINLSEITIVPQGNQLNSPSRIHFTNIFLVIYTIGVIYTLWKLIHSLLIIKSYYNQGTFIQEDGYKIIKTDKPIIAFSFFNLIFINNTIYKSHQKEKILIHELVHVNQGHSYDIFILEILKSLFWFNPILYIYRYFLIETHEFIADNNVIQNISKKTYGELLINQLQSGVQYNVANYFINSLTKNRIKMMYKTKSNRKWKYLLAIPTIAFMLFFINISNGQKQLNISNSKADEIATGDQKIFQTVDEMPRFPGCEGEATKKDKEYCSMNKLYTYLYSHLNYPKSAQENKLEGKVVAKFVVYKNGNIGKIKIIKDIGGGLGDEVKKLLENMAKLPEKWIPGRQGNKAVSTYYTLPVVFKLTDK